MTEFTLGEMDVPLQPELTVTCTNRTWGVSAPPRCVPVVCPELKPLVDGATVTYAFGVRWRSTTAALGCPAGM